MASERDISEMKSEIQRKLYEKPIPSEIVTVVASDDPDPDRNSVASADDSDSSDSENSDGNSDEREVVPHKIPVTAPRTEFPVEIPIPAPPIKISAVPQIKDPVTVPQIKDPVTVPQIKDPVTVPQVVRQIEINSDRKENHEALDSSSDDDVGRYMIRRRDGEMEMPGSDSSDSSDSSDDIGRYEFKRRDQKNSDSSVDSSPFPCIIPK